MVSVITVFGRNGLSDWLWQRVSAVILTGYTIFLISFFATQDITYDVLKTLFSHALMQYASTFVLLSLLGHAWIGIWTVITDYVKPLSIRLPLQCAIIFFLIGLLIWGCQIIWSI